MKKLLIRAASGFVYVVLVIFVIGFTPWFHQRMLGYARTEAHLLLEQDPDLTAHPALRDAVQRLFRDENALN